MEPTSLLILATCAFLFAGLVKGTVGIGFPTAAIGFLTLVLDPRYAISIVIIPMFFTNAIQMLKSGNLSASWRRYWPLVIVQTVVLLLTLFLTSAASDQILFGVLAFVILSFVITNTLNWVPRVPDRVDLPAQWGVGTVAGLLGGLISVWAPPIIIYLSARGLDKDAFIRAVGFIITLGCIPLLFGHFATGALTLPLFWQSCVMLIPTYIGFALGERVRDRLSEKAFHTALMLVFFCMGLNLLRRAIMGG